MTSNYTSGSDNSVPRSDDARSADSDEANQARSTAEAAATFQIKRAIESTKPAPMLSSRQRDIALVAVAGLIGYAISGLVSR